jgi:hypothetical protein
VSHADPSIVIHSSLFTSRTDSPLTTQRFITANGSLTDHGGSSGKAHDLHSEDAHFQSHPEHSLFYWDSSWFRSVTPGKCLDII